MPVKCDDCGKDVMTPYVNYIKLVKKNGLYRCRACATKIGRKDYNEKKKQEAYSAFIKKCNENNCIPLTTYADYKGVHTNMEYICPTHGKTHTLMATILHHGAWCEKCAQDKAGDNTRLSPEQVKELVESKNNNILLNPEEYINSGTNNLKVVCGSCGEVFTTSLSSIKASGGRCQKCRAEAVGDALRTSKEEFLKMATEDGELMVLNPDDYVDMNTPLLFKCAECGTPFEQIPRYYVKLGFSRCHNCRHYSKGEEIIASALRDLNIFCIR